MKGQVEALVKAKLAASKKSQEQETKEISEISYIFYDLAKSQTTIKPSRPKEDEHEVSTVSAAFNLNTILKKRQGSP